MDRTELAATLRMWRERISPSDVGLPAGLRRRTPGLRREEVAHLAGVSVDYLVRLEQARGPYPSEVVLGTLARALRLSEAERDHLFRLAGVSPPGAGRIRGAVRPSVRRLFDRFADVPAMLVDAKTDVLAWNPVAAALLGDYSAVPHAERNVAWQAFLGGGGRTWMDTADRERISGHLVADLRRATARYPDDPGLRGLIGALLAGSPRFTDLWARRDVEEHQSERKTIHHPDLGEIVLDCDHLRLDQDDQVLIVYSAEPGTPSARALELLRAVADGRGPAVPTAGPPGVGRSGA
ncbi:helix-turn-helix transcriptional regulator [Umezawaea endophytica]|uniref:Helix-turn-helix transcriptional regulator n=1 Tax=Umezawaea endophytica TaxID=1654476 RepID=A0A9X2VPT6_9PSEU|nr:helix-turn-helix transcriptional regulator [Umezawaea endophytica]MCS7480379.1 helix-turn-helix transcriptional regulator [Umezawaea endophytica]